MTNSTDAQFQYVAFKGEINMKEIKKYLFHVVVHRQYLIFKKETILEPAKNLFLLVKHEILKFYANILKVLQTTCGLLEPIF
jgi:hypothetical protein